MGAYASRAKQDPDFDPSKVTLKTSFTSESDEGTGYKSEYSYVYYGDEKFYTYDTSSTCNIGGAHGFSHESKLSSDKKFLVVTLRDCSARTASTVKVDLVSKLAEYRQEKDADAPS